MLVKLSTELSQSMQEQYVFMCIEKKKNWRANPWWLSDVPVDLDLSILADLFWWLRLKIVLSTSGEHNQWLCMGPI